jgi:hypothetical protein
MRISVFPKGQLDALVVDRTLTAFDWITMAKVLPIEGLELYSRMFDDTSDSFVDRVGEALRGWANSLSTRWPTFDLHHQLAPSAASPKPPAQAIVVLEAAGFEAIIVETAGVGQ